MIYILEMFTSMQSGQLGKRKDMALKDPWCKCLCTSCIGWCKPWPRVGLFLCCTSCIGWCKPWPRVDLFLCYHLRQPSSYFLFENRGVMLIWKIRLLYTLCCYFVDKWICMYATITTPSSWYNRIFSDI